MRSGCREYRGPATRSPTVGARVIDADARFVRQVRAPKGRLRLPRQIGDELLPGVEQFPLVDDVVAVEDGAALVAERASVRRQAPRNVASILDSARELGIRDAQGWTRGRVPDMWPDSGRPRCAFVPALLILPDRPDRTVFEARLRRRVPSTMRARGPHCADLTTCPDANG